MLRENLWPSELFLWYHQGWWMFMSRTAPRLVVYSNDWKVCVHLLSIKIYHLQSFAILWYKEYGHIYVCDRWNKCCLLVGQYICEENFMWFVFEPVQIPRWTGYTAWPDWQGVCVHSVQGARGDVPRVNVVTSYCGRPATGESLSRKSLPWLYRSKFRFIGLKRGWPL